MHSLLLMGYCCSSTMQSASDGLFCTRTSSSVSLPLPLLLPTSLPLSLSISPPTNFSIIHTISSSSTMVAQIKTRCFVTQFSNIRDSRCKSPLTFHVAHQSLTVPLAEDFFFWWRRSAGHRHRGHRHRGHRASWTAASVDSGIRGHWHPWTAASVNSDMVNWNMAR